MANIKSYEILSKRKGKWEVEGVTSNKEDAKEQALESLGTGHYEAVKVIGESIDDATGESSSFTVLIKEDQRKSKDAKPPGAERRKKTDKNKGAERRKIPNRRRKDRRKTKKSPGGFVSFLVKSILALWAIIATAAFLICLITSQ